ncbi:Hypothetical predicted protein [Octopus vulgaris]|uniref:Uncharacterized protein n=1 Tax=Octopus vulgaris TaxID=6645 RepID=A0AA36FEN6_OCTVU|nr:Hypothetical predicted protein [Octopus vulgaris]
MNETSYTDLFVVVIDSTCTHIVLYVLRWEVHWEVVATVIVTLGMWVIIGPIDLDTIFHQDNPLTILLLPYTEILEGESYICRSLSLFNEP